MTKGSARGRKLAADGHPTSWDNSGSVKQPPNRCALSCPLVPVFPVPSMCRMLHMPMWAFANVGYKNEGRYM